MCFWRSLLLLPAGEWVTSQASVCWLTSILLSAEPPLGECLWGSRVTIGLKKSWSRFHKLYPWHSLRESWAQLQDESWEKVRSLIYERNDCTGTLRARPPRWCPSAWHCLLLSPPREREAPQRAGLGHTALLHHIWRVAGGIQSIGALGKQSDVFRNPPAAQTSRPASRFTLDFSLLIEGGNSDLKVCFSRDR